MNDLEWEELMDNLYDEGELSEEQIEELTRKRNDNKKGKQIRYDSE